MGQSQNPAKKAAAKKAPAKKAAPAKAERTAEQILRDRQERLEERRQAEFDQAVDQATTALSDLEDTVTQREWLQVTQGLDRTRDQIAKDGSLRLLALGYVKIKREEPGDGWDALLAMTDKDLVRLHGFPDETPQETKARLEASASETPPEERNSAPLEERVPGDPE